MQNVSSSNSEKALVPKLRFPEFTDEWENIVLKNIAEFCGGGTPSKKNQYYWNGDIAWISSSDLLENNINEVKISRFINNEAIENSATKLCPKGTILIVSRVGVGKVAISNSKVCTSQDFTNITNTTQDKKFIAYILLQKMRNEATKTQGTSIKGITSDVIKNFKLSIPTIPEQEKISTFLSLIDKKIQLQQQLIENLKLYKRGVLHRIFNKEFKSKTFTEWKEKSLKSVFHLARGYVLPVSEISVVKTSEYQYPVYSSQTKNDGLLGYYNQYLFEDAITWTTDGANAGYTRFRKGKFYCTNVCGVLISNDNQANEYIAERINYVTKKHVSYVGNPKLMNNVMAEIKIDFPEISEQQYYSKFIEKLNIKLYNFESQFDVLEKLKTGILQQMFI